MAVEVRLRAFAGADLAFLDSGNTRSDIDAGPITYADAFEVQAYQLEKIDLKTIAVPGKITVVDYWAEWCSPCHFLEKRLHHLMNESPNMALRRVNVGKWDNAAAKQATAEFRLEALPYVRVYDARGEFVDDVTGGSWDQFLKVLEKARARG